MQNKRGHSRSLWVKPHLYLALALGFFFALLGLAGSLSVYGEALDELLNPELIIENTSGKHQPLDQIMAAVQQAHPNRQGAWTLEMPRSPEGTLTAWYEYPLETASKLYAPLMVSVNPYTAEVVASRFWSETAATWLLDLHTQLHLGRLGWNAVGGLGLALMVSAVTGMYLWWPGLAEWRRAFAIRRKVGASQLALDLHRLLGLFSAVLLLILAFTGFNLAFPKLPEALAGSSGMSHNDKGPLVRSTAIPNSRPVGLEEAVLLARGPFPHAEVRRVTTPDGPDGTYRISLWQHSEANLKHPATTVWVDRYSGQIREVRNPSHFTTGETALTWLWPLHTGEALGSWGRFLWFLGGLSPALLYATGMLRWLILQGRTREFIMDFSPLPRRLVGLIKAVARLGRKLYRHFCSAVFQAMMRASHLVQAGIRSYQKSWEKRAR